MSRQSQELMEELGFPNTSTLADICFAIHGHVVRYSDYLQDKDIPKYVKVLECAIKTWTPSKRPFDFAMKILIQATLDEFREAS